VRDNRRANPLQWKYDSLKPNFNPSAKLFQNSNFPQLKGSDELWPLVKSAIKNKNKENALKVVEHIKYFNVGKINSYRIILKAIKKAFKEIDITDVL
jgi:hypothetical protein